MKAQIITDNIDLRKCVKGDVLIGRHGAVMRYLRPLPEKDYYDHAVEYVLVPGSEYTSFGNGSRTHDGHVFRNNRKPETDQDVIAIIRNRCA